MLPKAKRFVRFTLNLCTIKEAAEIQDSSAVSFVSLSSLQPVFSSNMRGGEDGGKTLSSDIVTRKSVLSTQMRSRSEEKPPTECNVRKIGQPCKTLPTKCCRNGIQERTKNGYQTKEVRKELCDLKEVEILFPEFFCCGPNSRFMQVTTCICCDESETEINDLANARMKDPLIQSWLNYFGARPL